MLPCKIFPLLCRAGLIGQSGENVGQQADEILVGREPLHIVEGSGVEPAGCVVLVEGEAAVVQAAEKAVHGEVEVGVVVVDGGEELVDCDVGIQLFVYLADKGFLRAFAGLDFAAGELPPAFPRTVAALCGKNGVATADDGGHHFDGSACRLPGFLFASEKHLRRAVHDGYGFVFFHVG